MKKMFAAGVIFTLAISSMASGIVNVSSDFSVEETSQRLETILKKKGMKIFNHINHSKGAKGVGIDLRDTKLIIFGNPKVGSPLMKCQQTVALDLPQKALIWKDDMKKVWISYNDPKYLVQRHDLKGCEKVLGKVEKALAGIIKAAATK
ncbi:DUF302 domain-containing protein [Arcobacter sp. LA11]|uniref:DUF302 domain-containing protein n=1 Tax=Arcobacter sp. LA11 TaxID=1898176 RepID=UPI00093326CC|nr:DUF302 domain-containing protein [Arcobacter sp. LA11]